MPLYTLLKLVAFIDRKAPKDLAGVLHCLEHYLDADDRRYGLEHDGGGVPFEYTSAYLLGGDAKPFLDSAVRSGSRRSPRCRTGRPDLPASAPTLREKARR